MVFFEFVLNRQGTCVIYIFVMRIIHNVMAKSYMPWSWGFPAVPVCHLLLKTMLRACEKTQLILIDSTKTHSRFNGLLYKEYYHIINWLFLTLKNICKLYFFINHYLRYRLTITNNVNSNTHRISISMFTFMTKGRQLSNNINLKMYLNTMRLIILYELFVVIIWFLYLFRKGELQQNSNKSSIYISVFLLR